LKIMKSVLVALATCHFAASAAIISVTGPTEEILLGSQVAVDLSIGDVTNLDAPSISGYSVRLSFDPTILAPKSLEFGPSLDLGSGSSRDFSSAVGSILIQEFSFATAADLINLQPGSFHFARLTFDTVAPGTSILNLTILSMLDQNGTPLSSTVANTTLRVATAPIPEPSMFGGVGVALALLFFFKR
jgi:hypothetical protein